MLLQALKVALLLFGSGACALIYQTTWLRELRLVFGASTPASAAVLAIFMGGLGAGGLLLGRRVERHPKPLALYARLELLTAISAALTPLLLQLVRSIYVAMGGSLRLGLVTGTIVRLVLAGLVLSIPTLLMGGTLPAAARAVATRLDTRRRSLAVLYSLNTLGALAGAALSTFYLLECLGNRATLWLACGVNAGVAAVAFLMAPRFAIDDLEPASTGDASDAQAHLEQPMQANRFVLLSAFVVGMVFLLMELVWYRMLGPLLGGTSFTFGLILAVALLGIAIGGLCYSMWGEGHPATLRGFALICILEALGLAVPFALGDRVALLAAALRALGMFGFAGQALGWAFVTGLVILPAAVAAGVQFPLLIGLLGRGREQVGRQVGLAYAWNTAGAIVGSLLGGFGLLPVLSAPGTWRLSVWLLATLGALAMFLSMRRTGGQRQRIFWWPLFLALSAILIVSSHGPTAVWRHSGIGGGRVDLPEDIASHNIRRDWENYTRRNISWEADGVESSVAISTSSDLAFLVNGKPDGSTYADAPTFLLGGLLGAILHEQPKRALVIGLGTGITAGWLGAVSSMERVDVVEIEPAILHVAKQSAPVNHNVLGNSKVHITIGDGREVLLTDAQRYDLIVSQPSNPYRAGVAGLFTAEYYQSAQKRLAPGGLFLQWLQAYEVSNQTLRTIYATLASTFPVVETWMTQPGDLLLIGSMEAKPCHVERLRQRIAQEPYRSALLHIMRLDSLEGLLGHYLASGALATDIARQEGAHSNTDDRNEVEFAFARTLGGTALLDLKGLQELLHASKKDQPVCDGGSVDWEQVAARHISMFTLREAAPPLPSYLSEAQRQRARMHGAYLQGDFESAMSLMLSYEWQPNDLVERSMFTDLLIQRQDERALDAIKQLHALQPTEADVLQGLWHLKRNELPEAASAFVSAFHGLRHDPWPARSLIKRALRSLPELVARDKTLIPRLYESLQVPFAVYAVNEVRIETLVNLAAALDDGTYCTDALSQIGSHILWQERFLRWRLACYERTGQRRLAIQAAQDLSHFLNHQAPAFAPSTQMRLGG